MRRGLIAVLAVALVQALFLASAWAEAADQYGPATTACTISDPQIDELSGLVSLPGGDLLAVEDSTPEPQPGSTSILMYRLDAGCSVVGGIAEFLQDPLDIEDLAFANNTVWFADIGDNGASRDNVALIAVSYDPADPTDPEGPAAAPVVFRLGYPDGPHDAEALLLAPDGVPYIVTKDLLGRSSVYRPSGPLDSAAEVAMEKVADVEFSTTGTPGGPIGRAGQVLVTGGAVSVDGSRLALRTYTDAFVWELSDSDVAGALQADPLAVVALPDAPQGEAISFAEDSRSLLVGSEGVNSVITVVPAEPAADDAESDPGSEAATDPDRSASSATQGETSKVVAGLITAIVVTVILWVVLRIRRRGN